MQPLTRHGHRGHAVFVLPARPRRAAAQDGSPIRRAKNARSRRPSAPPATSPQKIRPVAQKFGPTTRHAMPLRLPRRREKVRSATRRAMPQADRGPPKRAPYGSHTAPRPATKIVLLVARRTPRTISPSAASQKTLGPAAMPCAPPRPATKIVLLVAHRTPRTIAPPAAPAAAPTAPAAPAAPAAGRPRAAKARAVWQPHRARPRRKILLLAARRDPSPRLPRRREKSGQTPDRMHPVPKRAPPARTGRGRVSRLSVSFLPPA